MSVCRVLSCSSDYLLFGTSADGEAWSDTLAQLRFLDAKYQGAVNKAVQGIVEAVRAAEQER